MNDALTAIAVAAFAYLLGSIPFGWLLSRAAGLGDIRAIGSGNIGATNVLRTGRRDIAALTLALDAAKGAAAVLAVAFVAGPTWALIAGIAAVIGHCTSIWMRGQGGKGVATALGVIFALAWPVGVACCIAWLCVARLTRLSSAGSLVTFALAPVLMLFWRGPDAGAAIAAVGAVVFLRHSGNIRRLIAGTEPRIGQGR
jgi:glycerol-3-phosphate acyltransferase PlsY